MKDLRDLNQTGFKIKRNRTWPSTHHTGLRIRFREGKQNSKGFKNFTQTPRTESGPGLSCMWNLVLTVVSRQAHLQLIIKTFALKTDQDNALILP